MKTKSMESMKKRVIKDNKKIKEAGGYDKWVKKNKQSMESRFDKETKKLTDKFERGKISGVEFDKRFKELSDKYLGTKLKRRGNENN